MATAACSATSVDFLRGQDPRHVYLPPNAACFCDVSSSCDAYCCCDNDCPAALKHNWNNFTRCASDGYAIPLCSYYYNQTMHAHDLHQGLRVVYTVTHPSRR